MDTNTGRVVTKHSDILTDHTDDGLGDDMKHHSHSVSAAGIHQLISKYETFSVCCLVRLEFLKTLLSNPSRKWAYYALWVPTKNGKKIFLQLIFRHSFFNISI